MNDFSDPLAAEEPYPLQRTLGFKITEWAENYARLELPIADHLMNRYGIPHGGVYATILDTVLGFSGSYTGSGDNKQMAMTLSLNVSYLSRPKGKLLICEGRKTGGGRKTFFADGILFDETGEKIASASGVFRYRSGA
ncbi:PaaI family thioesterase [uncultured Roseibium sp.]|uniref:PaaI family thioesterase n=1 Tax=uncultured Roseibium sp. TaxID=1936171 RepID=UPI00321698F9